jgi:hypothetical protein
MRLCTAAAAAIPAATTAVNSTAGQYTCSITQLLFALLLLLLLLG